MLNVRGGGRRRNNSSNFRDKVLRKVLEVSVMDRIRKRDRGKGRYLLESTLKWFGHMES